MVLVLLRYQKSIFTSQMLPETKIFLVQFEQFPVAFLCYKAISLSVPIVHILARFLPSNNIKFM